MSKLFRCIMITLTLFIIMAGSLMFYKHHLNEGLSLTFLGLGGLIYFSYRLGKTVYGEDEEMKSIMSKSKDFKT